jgi:adenosylcobinamide-GDP ribazoletransferase
MRELKQALGFLTRIPLGRSYQYAESLSGAAVPWYGVVGAVIGLFLVALSFILQSLLGIPPMVVAALTVCGWVVITGALHIDGLADCGDAWMGGHDKTRILEIMKDMSCGAGAVVTVVLVLAVKIGALIYILQQGDFLALLFVPVIARIGLIVAIVKFPYVRDKGLGSPLHGTLSVSSSLMISGALVLILGVISIPALVLAVIGCGAGFGLVYLWIIRKVGGFTGDVYGALVEICEAMMLVALTVLM